MRGVCFILLVGLIFTTHLTFGQRKTGTSFNSKKKNKYTYSNKRITNYKGGKAGFNLTKKYFSLGLKINAMNYFGDLSPNSGIASTDISFTRPGFGFFVEHRVTPRLSWRSGYLWGRVRGSDFDSADPEDRLSGQFRYVRNLSFRNEINELYWIAIFDFYRNLGTYVSRIPFTPYFFFGISGFHHNPKGLVPAVDRNNNPLDDAGTWVELKPLGTEGQNAGVEGAVSYSNWQFSIPIGIGMRYRLATRFDIALEIGYRYLFFDHLDDVGGDYAELDVFGDDELARALSDRSYELITEGTMNQYAIDNTGIAEIISYTKEKHGYTIVGGYGESENTVRGDARNDDTYIVTSLQVKYILGHKMRRAKFR